MNNRKFILSIIIITLVILGGGVFLAFKLSQAPTSVPANSQAKVSLSKTSQDWGTVSMKDGKVSAVFPIKNDGSDNLILSAVSTSCACTSAQLRLGDQTSPLFGMHTRSGYTLAVPPGDTAELEVVFDPAFHGPSGVGPITRQAKVSTNDPEKPALTFNLSALVTR